MIVYPTFSARLFSETLVRFRRWGDCTRTTYPFFNMPDQYSYFLRVKNGHRVNLRLIVIIFFLHNAKLVALTQFVQYISIL